MLEIARSRIRKSDKRISISFISFGQRFAEETQIGSFGDGIVDDYLTIFLLLAGQPPQLGFRLA